MTDAAPPDTPCRRCKGAGRTLHDLRSLGIGPGGTAFLAAGGAVRRYDDGSVWHELVCCRCDGTGKEPTP